METSEDTPTPVLANPTLQRSDETEHSSRAKSKSEFCGSGDNLARKEFLCEPPWNTLEHWT